MLSTPVVQGCVPSHPADYISRALGDVRELISSKANEQAPKDGSAGRCTFQQIAMPEDGDHT